MWQLYRKGSFTYQCLKIEKLKFASTVILERFAGYRKPTESKNIIKNNIA